MPLRAFLPLALLAILTFGVSAAAPPINLDLLRCPRPAEFAFVFSAGYAGDKLPTDNATFEKLLETIRKGGFNVVHCTFSESRLSACKKHGVRMMVDLLAPEHHVYKTPEASQKLCERLRGEDAVWGYNIWNDPIGKSGAGRSRDIRSVRSWDPTHPAFCGIYRSAGLRHLYNGDMIGYYDFHWKRGIDQHFGHLSAFHQQAKATRADFMTWLSSSSGVAGKGNFNRNLYSTNTALACGAKGIIWFLGSELLDLRTLKWTPAGEDILKIQARVTPIARILHPLGQPEEILTTKTTKTPNDRPHDGGKERLPPGLTGNLIGEKHWLRVTAGECLLGVFRDKERRPVVYVTNHNAYAENVVKLKAAGGKKASIYSREKGQWLGAEMSDGVIEVKLQPGDGELLRFEDGPKER